jgi:nucleotide-binding universal stress UspA family protein
MKTILIPIDFSKNSVHSANYGSILAKQLNAKITFLNIYSVPIVSEYNLPYEIENSINANKIEAIEKMDSFVNKFIVSSKIPIEMINQMVEYGFVAEKIIDVAKQIKANMIVMGTKGITNAFDKWIGNVAQKVKTLAEIPLWVIPEKAHLDYPKAILYASDFVGNEEEALKILFEVARPLDAKCDVIHIHEKYELNVGHQIEAMVSFLEDTFENEKATFGTYNCDDIIEGLEKYINIHKPDVLAMATHEKSFIDKLFEKSVSKHFIQEAKLPILCFKKL